MEFLLKHQVKLHLVYESSHQGSIRTRGTAVVCYINKICICVLQVVMKLVRLLPDGHRMKREVDLALDSVSETMTPLHYHLREVIISSYRQVEGAPSSRGEHTHCFSLTGFERFITSNHLTYSEFYVRTFVFRIY